MITRFGDSCPGILSQFADRLSSINSHEIQRLSLACHFLMSQSDLSGGRAVVSLGVLIVCSAEPAFHGPYGLSGTHLSCSGRDARRVGAPRQIRTSAINAYGSYE